MQGCVCADLRGGVCVAVLWVRSVSVCVAGVCVAGVCGSALGSIRNGGIKSCVLPHSISRLGCQRCEDHFEAARWYCGQAGEVGELLKATRLRVPPRPVETPLATDTLFEEY